MKTETLESVAKKLVAPGKGILAADESSGTIEKRLKSINVPSTEENRRAYREVLFTTKGAGEFISGVILFDETIRQKTRDGRTFVEALEGQGIIPGIKVDKGAKPMANFAGEKITEGLDGLRDRLAEYRQLGARFARKLTWYQSSNRKFSWMARTQLKDTSTSPSKRWKAFFMLCMSTALFWKECC